MASDLIIQTYDNLTAFRSIDAYPQVTTSQIKSIKDMSLFAVPLARTHEILVDPAQIGSILEQIRVAQLPEQEAARARQQLREARHSYNLLDEPITHQNFHAQIMSIAA
jgi:hypothetical protein